ncbi:Uncharacterised protein [Escherichia coli]|nr:Uncharacterised protein [Escherichia coli]SRZ45029.1 Uncharacterised protein [Escherichia coli]
MIDSNAKLRSIQMPFCSFLTVDIFQLGIGLDTKYIAATKLTGFRQDLHQVRQFV